VALIRFLVSDLSVAGQFKPLFGAGVCFNFWHYNLIKITPAGVPGLPGHLSGLVGNKNLEREGIEIICTCKYFN
jgi:hypothetical protein